jgi:hypothetical protein
MIDGWKDRLRNALKISSPFQNNVYRGFCSVEGGRKGDVYDLKHKIIDVPFLHNFVKILLDLTNFTPFHHQQSAQAFQPSLAFELFGN